MHRLSTPALAIAAAMSCPIACGGGNGGSSMTTGGDAGDDGGSFVEAGPVEAGPVLDHGAPSTTYPAFTPDIGQIVYNAGYVMTTPVIVPITWDVDPWQGKFDTFAGTVGATTYFHKTTSEYNVMAAIASPPVHIRGAAPQQLGDSDLQNMVTANAGVVVGVGEAGAGDDAGAGGAGGDAGVEEGGAGVSWPAATENTIYAFFLPPGTSLNLASGKGPSGDACSQGIGGYHDQVTVGRVTTSYAVVPSCNFGQLTVFDWSTIAMSHEIIEASTDPDPQDKFFGWDGFDPDHFAFDWFQQFQGSEVADACEFFPTSDYQEIETSPVFDFYVQRTWSNLSAIAGHNPCVPLAPGPYFNVTPMNLKYVSVTLPPSLTGSNLPEITTTRGVRILPGDTGTIELGFYSDARTGGDWTVTGVDETDGTESSADHLSVSIDRPSGQNGQKAYATVTVMSAGSMNAELLVFHSTLYGVTNVMPVVVSSE
jgi:hypothetical protein